MKAKVKVAILLMMVIFCITPSQLFANAATSTKTIDVHANIWSIHLKLDYIKIIVLLQ